MRFLAGMAAPVLALVSALWIYDPLQLFHAHWGRPQTLHANMRLQAAGVMRHESFDSVVLGTSMMENTSADEAGRLLGGRFVNISLTASDYVERSIVLTDLLRRRRIEQVIYSLDSVYMNTRRGYPPFPMNTYDFLYDRNPFNDLRVYLNRHYLDCVRHWSDEPGCVGRAVSLDRPNAWFGETEHASRFGGLAAWCRARDHYQIKDARALLSRAMRAIDSRETPENNEKAKIIRQALDYVDEHVMRVVRAHPTTRFHLVFPPYSRALFAIWHQSMPINSSIHQEVVRYLAMQASQTPNLVIHGFETESFLDDLANYKDLGHYRESIDSLILRAVAAGTHVLDAANVETYLAHAVARARAFDLQGLQDRLEQCRVIH